MRAIILAAGRGSRMKNLTDDRPKCLLEVGGKALLDWQLDAIHAVGIREVGIVTGYRRELLVGRGDFEFYNQRWDRTNMVASLMCADEWLGDAPCVISYSDIFYYPSAINLLTHSEADIAITYDPGWHKLWKARFENPLHDAETFRLDSDGNLAEIGNKPETTEEIQGQYMGLTRMTPNGWKEFKRLYKGLEKDVRDKIHMTGTIQKVLEQQKLKIAALPYLEKWGEIDSTHDLQAASFKGICFLCNR